MQCGLTQKVITMLQLNKDTKTLVDTPAMTPTIETNLKNSGPINIGMNFEDGLVVIEINTEDSNGNTSIISLPVEIAYAMGSQTVEACAIINFVRAVGIKIPEQGE